MNSLRKHEKLFKVVIAIASLGLVASSLLPLLTLR